MNAEPHATTSSSRTRNWVLIVVGVCLALLVVGMALAGGFAYYIFRQTSIETTSSKGATDRFEQVRARFKDRTPYIELRSSGVLKVHHELEQAREVDLQSVRILAWDADDNRLAETSIPFWFVRLKASSPFSLKLGRVSRDLEVTAHDLARFGAGIIVDFEEPGGTRVLVWTE
ncbi:MAG: hypothetical protein HYS05_07010 [Acidobacteria bacterium]|nr:hypothetical protein [Acidobacteriota bacterium]